MVAKVLRTYLVKASVISLALLCIACSYASAQEQEQGDGSHQATDIVARAEQATQSVEQTATAPLADTQSHDQKSAPSDTPAALHAEGNTIDDALVPDSSFLNDISISELSSADPHYDKQLVQVRGEAVGEAIKAAGGNPDLVWITLCEQKTGSSISVVMSKQDAGKIDTYGAYGKTGTRLRVQGEFYIADPEFEGESLLRAHTVTVEKEGFVEPDPFKPEIFIPGLIMLVVGVCCTAAFWHKRERSL